jgi:hypothetical protein
MLLKYEKKIEMFIVLENHYFDYLFFTHVILDKKINIITILRLKISISIIKQSLSI